MAANQKTDRIGPQAFRGYSKKSGLVLGFHGTDLAVVHDVVLHREELKASNNPWDWIGHGIYFWEGSISRAIQFAETQARRKGSSITTPGVIGAVLDLGNCFDLLDYYNLCTLKECYEEMTPELKHLQNRRVTGSNSGELLLRNLDCAVIEEAHRKVALTGLPFDSVRAVFFEGEAIYPNAGFREKNHIQICIRNPTCIKGLFIPRFG